MKISFQINSKMMSVPDFTPRFINIPDFNLCDAREALSMSLRA